MFGEKQSTGKAKSDSKGNGLSQVSMQAIMSADSSIKQAQVQGSTATKMKGRANVLKAEIKQDGRKNTEARIIFHRLFKMKFLRIEFNSFALRIGKSWFAPCSIIVLQ